MNKLTKGIALVRKANNAYENGQKVVELAGKVGGARSVVVDFIHEYFARGEPQTLPGETVSVSKSNKLIDMLNKYSFTLNRILQEFPITFYVVKSKVVNAYASPRGHTIVLYEGLLNMFTDEEVLYVVAHEIGHLYHKHSASKLFDRFAIGVGTHMIDSDFKRMLEEKLLADRTAVDEVLKAGFSQYNEREADDYALEFLLNNQIDPATSCLSALEKLATMGDSHSILLSTHPDSKHRKERLQELAEKRGKWSIKTKSGVIGETKQLFKGIKQLKE